MYTVVEDKRVLTFNLAALARIIFVFAAIASWSDAMTTWIVLRHTGLSKEGNGPMAYFMHVLGLGPVCAARFLIGVFAFWLLARHLMGNHQVLTKRQVRAYKRREARVAANNEARWWVRKLRFVQDHSAAIEIIFALCVTSAIVGNNIRALITLHMMS